MSRKRTITKRETLSIQAGKYPPIKSRTSNPTISGETINVEINHQTIRIQPRNESVTLKAINRRLRGNVSELEGSTEDEGTETSTST